MNKKLQSLISKTRILGVLILLISLFILFQGNIPAGHVFHDNDPLLDQPTREFYTHFVPPGEQQQSFALTDPDGFDNYTIAIDGAEMWAVNNPNNPLWIFYGANGNPQNARNTTNGGLYWVLRQPFYQGGTCCDPWAVYLSTGTLVYGSGVNGQYVYRSTDNGNNWTTPVLSVSGNDRNTLGAELTGTGPYANYVYAAITPGNFSRSTDEGATWSQTYSYSNTVPGVMIAVGPNGTTNGGCIIYVTNSGSSANVTYTFHRSTNGGTSFQVMSSLTVAGYSGTYNSVGRLVINNARHRPYPFIAMDNSNGPYRGRLYLVYSSNIPAGNGNKPDIKLQYSTDQAATWSSYTVVNDNHNPEISDQWFPSIDCERTTGKLYIKWYDDRENPSAYTTGVWATYSTTGGTSFATSQRISNASWLYPCPSCSPNTNCYRGDYDAITANPVTSFAIWYDPRNCNYRSMGAYFPDYAMKVNPTSLNVTNQDDSAFSYMSIPAVKLYDNSVKFTASVSPAPTAGTITFTFLNKDNNNLLDTLTSFPDSLRMRVDATGGVTAGNYTITVLGTGPNGTPVHSRTIPLTVNPVGLSSNENEIPKDFYLYQNYPNPFNPSTHIRFDLAKSGFVTLDVYDITGRKVTELVNENLNAGKHNAEFNASELSSGIYFYRIVTPEFTSIRKMILVK
jgi:Secretion system C-terminal sorting domain